MVVLPLEGGCGAATDPGDPARTEGRGVVLHNGEVLLPEEVVLAHQVPHPAHLRHRQQRLGVKVSKDLLQHLALLEKHKIQKTERC